MDRHAIGWDRLAVAATTLRPALFPPRALAAAVVALVGGGWLMVLVVAIATGGDLTAGSAWWLALAGGAGCVSGVVLGSSGQAVPAAVVAVVAVGCLVLADAAAQPGQRGAEPQAAPPAREQRADPAPARERDAARSRGNAPAAPGPKQIVRSYYAALDARDFTTAWAMLSPGVQAAFGGFETWRRGYDSTLGHRVEDVTVAPGGVVKLVLVATDRTLCEGRTEQRFAVTWRLAGEQAAALGAVKLAGADPAAAC